MKKIGKVLKAIIDFPYIQPTPRQPLRENGYGICEHCGLEVPKEDLVNGYCSLCDEEESEGDIMQKPNKKFDNLKNMQKNEGYGATCSFS